VKALIHQPFIIFIEKDAMEFSPVRNLDHMICKFLCSTTMTDASVFLIFNSKFQTVCVMDRILLMSHGRIINQGPTEKFVSQWENDIEKSSPTEKNKDKTKLDR
jgi:ABC-type uncharacterized transport system ATPase subunit